MPLKPILEILEYASQKERVIAMKISLTDKATVALNIEEGHKVKVSKLSILETKFSKD